MNHTQYPLIEQYLGKAMILDGEEQKKITLILDKNILKNNEQKNIYNDLLTGTFDFMNVLDKHGIETLKYSFICFCKAKKNEYLNKYHDGD